MNLNDILAMTLTSKQAYAVKTLKGTWYTVYERTTLDKVINEGDFDYIAVRRIA